MSEVPQQHLHASRNDVSKDHSEDDESASGSSQSKEGYKDNDMISHKSYKSFKSMAVKKEVFNKTQIANLQRDGEDLEMGHITESQKHIQRQLSGDSEK